jgi:MYXO-CTERM domain-containing protein
MKRLLSLFAGMFIWALVPGSASAIVISSLDTPVAFTITQNIAGGIVLSASGSVQVTSGFNSSSLVMEVILNNASTLNGIPLTSAANVRLTGWGFGVDPDATGVTFADAADLGLIDASLDNLPSLAGIEVCAWGGNNCSGGANGGIQAGSNDAFSLILAGHWENSITFTPLGVRFQTPGNSYDFACPPFCAVEGGGDPNAIAEPQTLALFGLGLLALATFVRRRRIEH